MHHIRSAPIVRRSKNGPAASLHSRGDRKRDLIAAKDSREPTEAARPLRCDALVLSMLFGHQFLPPAVNHRRALAIGTLGGVGERPAGSVVTTPWGAGYVRRNPAPR